MIKNIPLSLKIISIISIWSALPLLAVPFIPFGAKAVGEWSLFGSPQSIEISTVVGILYALLNLLFVISVLKKYRWGWKIFLLIYLSMTINIVISTFVRTNNLDSRFQLVTYLNTILFSTVFMLLSFIVYKKRSYFAK